MRTHVDSNAVRVGECVSQKKALAHLRAMILVALIQVDKVEAKFEPEKKKRARKNPHVKLVLIKGGED